MLSHRHGKSRAISSLFAFTAGRMALNESSTVLQRSEMRTKTPSYTGAQSSSLPARPQLKLSSNVHFTSLPRSTITCRPLAHQRQHFAIPLSSRQHRAKTHHGMHCPYEPNTLTKQHPYFKRPSLRHGCKTRSTQSTTDRKEQRCRRTEHKVEHWQNAP